MTMLNIDNDTSSVRRQRRQRPQTPMELLVHLEQEHPNLSREHLLEEYIDEMLDRKNQELLLSAVETSFSLNYGKLHSKKKSPRASEVGSDDRKVQLAERNAKMKTVIEQARDTMIKNVVEVGFWDYPMPNGKRLHECSVKEARLMKPKIGGLLTVIDNIRGKPSDIIGEIYTKAELKKLAKT